MSSSSLWLSHKLPLLDTHAHTNHCMSAGNTHPHYTLHFIKLCINNVTWSVCVRVVGGVGSANAGSSSCLHKCSALFNVGFSNMHLIGAKPSCWSTIWVNLRWIDSLTRWSIQESLRAVLTQPHSSTWKTLQAEEVAGNTSVWDGRANDFLATRAGNRSSASGDSNSNTLPCMYGIYVSQVIQKTVNPSRLSKWVIHISAHSKSD